MIFSTKSPVFAGQKSEHFTIKGLKKLTGVEAGALRAFMETLNCKGFEKIYLDATRVSEVDLSGVNEIIHTHYSLQKNNLALVLVYRRHSAMEKWVETTGMNAYLQTAILPASC